MPDGEFSPPPGNGERVFGYRYTVHPLEPIESSETFLRAKATQIIGKNLPEPDEWLMASFSIDTFDQRSPAAPDKIIRELRVRLRPLDAEDVWFLLQPRRATQPAPPPRRWWQFWRK